MMRAFCRGLALLSALLPGACAVSSPFSGPGWERGRGVTAAGAGETVVVALTEATLMADRRSEFDRQSARLADLLEEQPGLIGSSLRTELFGDRVWTMTVWVDEDARAAFVGSPEHREAIRLGLPAVRSGYFHRYELAADRLPPAWPEAEALLRREGRVYRP